MSYGWSAVFMLSATPADPRTLRFTEDVTGIDTVNAQVLANVDFQPPTVVSRSWACLSAGGAQVDCAAVALRSATFVPAKPWSPGVLYNLDLAPNQTIGVRDLAGNPADTSQTGGFSLPTT